MSEPNSSPSFSATLPSPARTSLAAVPADPGAAVSPRRDPTGAWRKLRRSRAPDLSLWLPPAPPAHRLLVALPGGGQARTAIYAGWLRAAQAALRDQPRMHLAGRVALSLLCPRAERVDLAALEKAPVALLVRNGIIDDARNVETLEIAWYDGDELVVRVSKA
jgi:hypothetical protein